MLLAAGCGDDSETDENTDTDGGKTPAKTQTVISSGLIKTVGPINIPFTLNKSKPPVQVVVAEGETRLVKMQMETAQLTETHEEKVHTVTFAQTWLASSDVTESFSLGNKGIVDILMIIDDSDSMQGVHKQLKALVSGSNLTLMKGIENSNWQLALADTRPDSCLIKVINKSNISDYSKTLQVIEGVIEKDHHERAVYKSRKVLGLASGCTGLTGKDWFRKGSTLAVVVITDEDHQCSWANSPGNSGDGNTYHCGMQPIKAMYKKMTTDGSVDWLKLYGIMDETATCGDMRGNNSSGCYELDSVCSGITNPCFGRSNEHKFRSANFVDAGFFIKDINRSDYAGIFSEIVNDIKGALQDRFLLKAKPDMSKNSSKPLVVKINGNTVDESLYSVDVDNKILKFNNNSLQTLTAGVSNAIVQVSYQIDGTPSHVYKLTLDKKADITATGTAAMTISINGVEKVKGTDYTVVRNKDKSITITLAGDDAKRKLLFPEGATATVTYRELSQYYPPLVLKHYDLLQDTVTVHVDSGATTNFAIVDTEIIEHDKSNKAIKVKKKSIVFNSNHEPQHGQVVQVAYTYHTATQKLSYDDELQDKYKVNEISCRQKGGQTKTLSCTHANGLITFPTDAFQRDREVIASMTVEGLEKGEITVPDNLIDGTMKLLHGNSECKETQMEIANGVINLTSSVAKNKCSFLDQWASESGEFIELYYQTYIPKQSVEVVSSDILSYAGRYSNERWDVFLGGVQKQQDTDYTVKSRKITFTGTITPDTKGHVEVYLEP